MPDAFNLEKSLQELAESKDLLKAVSDIDYSKHIVDALCEATGLAKWKVQLAYKVIVPVLGHLGKGLGSLLAEPVKYRMLSYAQKLPGCEKTVKALRDASTKTIQEIQAKNEAKVYLRDRRPPDQEVLDFRREMSLEFGVALDNLIATEGIREELENYLPGIQEALGKITGFINPQPKFKEFLDDTTQNQLHYLSQHIPFVGRWNDFDRLEAFMASEGNFSWQLLAGPGGMGKSRLALEYCLAINGMYRAGIMTDGDTKLDYSKWQPDRPTLLVLDYASKDKKLPREILGQLTERRKDLDCKVRLLLLDRDSKPEWLKEIIGTDTAEAAILECHHSDPWEIQGLGNEENLEIMHYILENSSARALPDDKELLERLEIIDPLKRPLFAAILAQALAENVQLPKWDQNTLLRHVIQRRKKHFWTGVTEKDEALLALATMIGGVTSEDTTLPEGVSTIDELIRAKERERFKSLGGIVKTLEGTAHFIQAIPPWEPDIIGELFVLDFLKDDFDMKLTNPMRASFLELAWINKPFQLVAFLDRVAQDHPHHPSLENILIPNRQGLFLHVWTILAVNLAHWLPKHGRIDIAEKVQNYIELIRSPHLSNPHICEQIAKSTYNLLSHYCKTGNFKKANEKLHFLIILRDQIKPIELTSKYEAYASFTLAKCLCEHDMMDDAERVLLGIERLALTHQHDDIVKQYAYAALAIVTRYAQTGDQLRAKRVIDMLSLACATTITHHKPFEILANTYLNFIHYSATNKNFADSISALDELQVSYHRLCRWHDDAPSKGAFSPPGIVT